MSEFTIENGVLLAYTGDSDIVVIPDNVTKIDMKAFSKQNSIRTLTLPASLKTLAKGVLGSFRHLQILHCPGHLLAKLTDSAQIRALLGLCQDTSTLQPEDRDAYAAVMNRHQRALLQQVVANNDAAVLASCIAVCDTLGITPSFKLWDELIDQAQAEKRNDVTPWLLAYKQRANDPEAEENLRDDSLLAEESNPFAGWILEPEWNWDTLPEGTICITQYKGKGPNVIVPPCIDDVPVTRIGAGAMKGNPDVISIEISNGVTRIDASAFSGCKNLTRAELPTTLLSIGTEAFLGCGALKEVEFLSIGDAPHHPAGSALPEDAVIGVERNAFDSCRCLKSIALPDKMTTIGPGAFHNCAGMLEVILPQALTTIGENAFSGCGSLTAVHIPGNTVTIGEEAFADCINLEIVDIPQSVTKLSKTAFSGTQWDKNQGDWLIVDNRVIAYRGKEGKPVIPRNVTRIGEDAFRSCSSIQTIVIPDSVTDIGSHAFAYCRQLRNVTFHKGLSSIGPRAFVCCPALRQLDIPSPETRIGFGAFESTGWSYDQGDFLILNGVLLRYRGRSWSVSIPEGVTAIGDEAFVACSIASVHIPQSVTHIGHSAFFMCRHLQEIDIPQSVTHIGDYAFRRCLSLEKITFPDSLESVGQAILLGCPLLKRDASCTKVEALAPGKDLWGRTLENTVVAFKNPKARALYSSDAFEAAVRDAGGTLGDKKSAAPDYMLTAEPTAPARPTKKTQKTKKKEPQVIHAEDFMARYLPFYTDSPVME